MTASPLLIGPQEGAREMGIGRDAMYRLIHEGRIHVVRVGRRILIPRTELVAFVEREVSLDTTHELSGAEK